MSYIQFNPHLRDRRRNNLTSDAEAPQGSVKRAFSDWIIENHGSDYREALKKQRMRKGADRFHNCLTSKTRDLTAGQPMVGIIGGGFAGMYAGMILQSLGIEFEIFEGSDRVGGRIDTWYSRDYDPDCKDAEGLYGEVGGMRLPQFSEDMLPVQHLALVVNAVLKSNGMDDKIVNWRKFYYNSPVQRMRYNNMEKPIEAKDSTLDTLNFGTEEGGDLPMVWLTPTAQESGPN